MKTNETSCVLHTPAASAPAPASDSSSTQPQPGARVGASEGQSSSMRAPASEGLEGISSRQKMKLRSFIYRPDGSLKKENAGEAVFSHYLPKDETTKPEISSIVLKRAFAFQTSKEGGLKLRSQMSGQNFELPAASEQQFLNGEYLTTFFNSFLGECDRPEGNTAQRSFHNALNSKIGARNCVDALILKHNGAYNVRFIVRGESENKDLCKSPWKVLPLQPELLPAHGAKDAEGDSSRGQHESGGSVVPRSPSSAGGHELVGSSSSKNVELNMSRVRSNKQCRTPEPSAGVKSSGAGIGANDEEAVRRAQEMAKSSNAAAESNNLASPERRADLAGKVNGALGYAGATMNPGSDDPLST